MISHTTTHYHSFSFGYDEYHGEFKAQWVLDSYVDWYYCTNNKDAKSLILSTLKQDFRKAQWQQ